MAEEKMIKKLGPYQVAPDYSESIDLISPREEDLENDELTIRIGALFLDDPVTDEYPTTGWIESHNGDVSTGISLEKGVTFLVRDRTKSSIISLSPDHAGTPNVIRGNEKLEIRSHRAGQSIYYDSYISFITDKAGIKHEESTWSEYFKQLEVTTKKGINMEAKNNSYWWVNAEKKAVYGNSLNKLEFRTDGEAKFSKDVRAKNVKVEGTLTAKDIDINSSESIDLVANTMTFQAAHGDVYAESLDGDVVLAAEKGTAHLRGTKTYVDPETNETFTNSGKITLGTDTENVGIDISSPNNINISSNTGITFKPLAGSVNISGTPHIEMTTNLDGSVTTDEWNDVTLSSSDNIVLESERDISVKATNKVLINDIDVIPKLKAIPGATPTAINDNFAWVPVEGSDGVTRYMLVANTVEALTNLVTA